MNLNELKSYLAQVKELTFIKDDGTAVPKHFHLTELGQITKQFMDCGGTLRNYTNISLQLKEGLDIWHRLTPEKFLKIVVLAEQKLKLPLNESIEVEYQAQTIGKYFLNFKDGIFILNAIETACLANSVCKLQSALNFNNVKAKIKACC